MEWVYKGIPLKDYLASIIKDKSELKYLYSTVRKILKKEYREGMDMDSLISDVLNRDKIQKIINGEHVKQEKRIWNYRGIPLKEHLARIIKNKDDLKYLYSTIRTILDKEYTDDVNLDLLIENILNRPKIRDIINGEYTKTTEEKWYYEGMPLVEYINLNIKSPYRNLREIRQKIKDYATAQIKRNHLDLSKREEIIRGYINSSRFQQFITTPPKKTLSYFYEGEGLHQYLEKNVRDSENLNYIYSLIVRRITIAYNSDSNEDLDSIINRVMTSEEVVSLINMDNINKIEREAWPYKDGLLIDYLRSIDLNGKDIKIVYMQVKDFINRRYPNGFQNLDEKRRAIEDYIASEYFSNYIKYGYTNKIYYYRGMLLIDYIRMNYGETLKALSKTPENLYNKIIYMLSTHENIENLCEEEIEHLIGIILESNEIKEYLTKKKNEFETWPYKDGLLIDYLRSIDLNGKDIKVVYSQVKNFINSEYPDGFQNLDEKRRATEDYIASEHFSNYLKQIRTKRTYYFRGMLLIDYIRINYSEILKPLSKTPENLFNKIIYMLSTRENIENLCGEEVEHLIGIILKSDEIKVYLTKKKTEFESWSYYGKNLRDIIGERFESIILDEYDLYRIYGTITKKARIIKSRKPEMDNNDVIGEFLTDEYIEDFKEKYTRRKEIRKEVEEKTRLYQNKDDFEYIRLYAKSKDLSIDEIIRIKNRGFNNYSAIIILEYSLKYGTPIDELIDFTLDTNISSDNYLLWLFKLGFRDYIYDIIEKNEKLIKYLIYKAELNVFKSYIQIDYGDAISYLIELLMKKHIGITVSIDNLFYSFRLFIQSCMRIYFLNIAQKPAYFRNAKSINAEDFFIQLSSKENIEEDYIAREDDAVIKDAINELDELEQEFIDLRYGFSGNIHSLSEIKRIWDRKGITMPLEDLELMETEVLSKLRNNPNLIDLGKGYSIKPIND